MSKKKETNEKKEKLTTEEKMKKLLVIVSIICVIILIAEGIFLLYKYIEKEGNKTYLDSANSFEKIKDGYIYEGLTKLSNSTKLFHKFDCLFRKNVEFLTIKSKKQ